MSRTSSPSFSSSASVVDAQLESPPVTYLQAYSEFGVLLCSEHRCCYTPFNYSEHLQRAHGLKGLLKKKVDEWVKSQNISDQVLRPSHYRARLPDLQILSGWKCNVGECMETSQSEEVLQRHGSSKHQLRSQRQQREGGA
jgi:hypothetical protein